MPAPNKVSLTAKSSYTTDDQLATDLRAALVANNSIPTIQETLHNELQRTGWSSNLRAYLIQLMRSGECTNYDQLMARVLHESLNGINGPDKIARGPAAANAAAANAAHSTEEDPGLRIPDTVKDTAVKIVHAEIAKIADIDAND